VTDTITLKEAADRLSTTPLAIRQLIRRGFLRPIYLTGVHTHEPPRLYAEEVAAFAELRFKNIGLAEVAALAKIASIHTAGLTRQVERLTEFLGVDVPVLDLRDDAILRLYAEIEYLLEYEELPITAQFIMLWGKRFYAMGEEVFEQIERVTGDREPWKKPLDLATKMFLEREETKDFELETAYRYMLVGRRFMRQAAYFHIRAKLGARIAHHLFKEVEGDINHKILAVLTPS
jgi:hypothetical protein